MEKFEGIVKELGGRTVIQFHQNPGDFILFGCMLSGREYNNTWVYSAGKIKEALSTGTIVTVTNGQGSIEQINNNPTMYNAHAGQQLSNDNSEVIALLKEIRDLLKKQPKEKAKSDDGKVYKKYDGRTLEVTTIKGIKCYVEDNPKDIAAGWKYIPMEAKDDGEDLQRFIREHGIINNKGDYANG